MRRAMSLSTKNKIGQDRDFIESLPKVFFPQVWDFTFWASCLSCFIFTGYSRDAYKTRRGF
jgi:hypothetical protein